MVKCSKAQIRQLKTALRWEIPAAQRQRIQMVLLRESGMAQPAIAAVARRMPDQPSAARNIRLSSDVANPLSRSPN